jgi:hypothetical protein
MSLNQNSLEPAQSRDIAEHRLFVRKRIVEFERLLLEDSVPPPPLVHHFAPGLYAREIHLQEGLVCTGKIHRYAHITTISKGSVAMVTEHGSEIYEAPCSFVSSPGDKRCVLALEDTVLTTYHPTDKTDLDEIEKEVISDCFLDEPEEL